MNIKFKLLPLSIAIATVLTPLAASADDSLTFSGYARYGAKYSTTDAGDNNMILTPGSLQNRGVGRLGNNGNGGEFQFTKNFGTADNGTKWQMGVMIEHWWESMGLKKFYAKATNVFASQPNATVWAGRDFHQRPQTSLTDFYYMSHDGQGIGIKDLEFDGVKLNFAAVAEADNGAIWDNGNYAITTKLHDIEVGSAKLAILANYGFASDGTGKYDGGAVANPDLQAGQIAGVLTMGPHKVVARYSNNVGAGQGGEGASVFAREAGTDSYYLGFESNYYASDAFRVEYAAAYAGKSYETAADRNTFSIVARPMYAWDDIHSTWLEAGYEYVDQDLMYDGASAFKVTLSQNISIQGMAGRPMIRLYATAGQEDDGAGTTTDKFNLGGMFEAWW